MKSPKVKGNTIVVEYPEDAERQSIDWVKRYVDQANEKYEKLKLERKEKERLARESQDTEAQRFRDFEKQGRGLYLFYPSPLKTNRFFRQRR